MLLHKCCSLRLYTRHYFVAFLILYRLDELHKMLCTEAQCDYHRYLPDFAKEYLSKDMVTVESSMEMVFTTRPVLWDFVDHVHKHPDEQLTTLDWMRYYFCCSAYRAAVSQNMTHLTSAITFATTILEYDRTMEYVTNFPMTGGDAREHKHPPKAPAGYPYPEAYNCHACEILQYTYTMLLLADCDDLIEGFPNV